ncbi:MAG: LPP20 family lipoprotein [Gammaproteobacteria bacterium]|nr:LPP20 family lipoprotein [Gammaproteobacteria bacterium]MDE2345865.1 LPP20 family lipoprotein [Gammaproteobacteria bacterium]
MNMRYCRNVCILLMGLLAACSQSPKPGTQPPWIMGSDAKYPASAYLLGRGQGDSLAVARDRARADLAKIFSVDVSEQTKDVASFTQESTGPTKNTLDVSRNLSTRTNEMLRGVEIGETWQDPATQEYYALAVLSRPKADVALRQQISDLDASTRAYLTQAQSSNDLFVKIANATQAVNAQSTRAGLQRELQVVDITGRGMPSEWNLGQLRTDRNALLARLKISAAATGQDAAAVQQVLAGALANAGFTVAGAGDYTMTANLNYANLALRGDGWYWITGALQVTLAANNGGQAHGVHRWDIKVSATDPQLVHQRLMDQIALYLNSDIQSTVLSFAEGTASNK